MEHCHKEREAVALLEANRLFGASTMLPLPATPWWIGVGGNWEPEGLPYRGRWEGRQGGKRKMARLGSEEDA